MYSLAIQTELPSTAAAPRPPVTSFHAPTPTLASIGAYAALGYVVLPVSVNAITPRPLAVTPIAGYVKSWPTAPRYPDSATFAASDPVERSGFTMYHAIPARAGPPSGFTVVSSAPHNLPFAYITCCMRVSFESGLATTSGLPAWAVAVTSSLQQPNWPLKSCVV